MKQVKPLMHNIYHQHTNCSRLSRWLSGNRSILRRVLYGRSEHFPTKVCEAKEMCHSIDIFSALRTPPRWGLGVWLKKVIIPTRKKHGSPQEGFKSGEYCWKSVLGLHSYNDNDTKLSELAWYVLQTPILKTGFSAWLYCFSILRKRVGKQTYFENIRCGLETEGLHVKY